MVSKKGFARDLAVGKEGERAVLGLLKAAGLAAGTNRAKKKKGRSRYDVWATLPDAGRVTFEIKRDVYSRKSGRLAVEYFNPRSNVPSGITATTSDIWVFVLWDSVWACRSDDLRRHHGKGEGGEGFARDLPVCGDKNSSATLYEREPFLDKLFFRLDGLPANELVAVLEVLAS